MSTTTLRSRIRKVELLRYKFGKSFDITYGPVPMPGALEDPQTAEKYAEIVLSEEEAAEKYVRLWLKHPNVRITLHHIVFDRGIHDHEIPLHGCNGCGCHAERSSFFYHCETNQILCRTCYEKQRQEDDKRWRNLLNRFYSELTGEKDPRDSIE